MSFVSDVIVERRKLLPMNEKEVVAHVAFSYR